MSVNKRQQSAAKRARELAIKERRALKQEKKDQARRAKREDAATPQPQGDPDGT
jgi:hypothetical protein